MGGGIGREVVLGGAVLGGAVLGGAVLGGAVLGGTTVRIVCTGFGTKLLY